MLIGRGVVLAGALVALPLHVEPQVSEAPAAGRFTFAFAIEHGCEDSATVEVAIQVPPGSFDVVPIEKPGWTATVEASDPPVVSFAGGSLPADVSDTFAVELVTPNAPGTEVLFPTVQVCESGELAWIEAEEGGDYPAPRVRLLENPDPVSSSTTASTTEETATTQPAPTTSSTTAADVEDDDDSDGEGDGGAVGVGVAAGIVVAGVAAWMARRRRR